MSYKITACEVTILVSWNEHPKLVSWNEHPKPLSWNEHPKLVSWNEHPKLVSWNEHPKVVSGNEHLVHLGVIKPLRAWCTWPWYYKNLAN